MQVQEETSKNTSIEKIGPIAGRLRFIVMEELNLNK